MDNPRPHRRLIPKAPAIYPDARFAGSAGLFQVWHVAKMDYRIFDSESQVEVSHKASLGEAHAAARRAVALRELEENEE